MNSAIYAYNNNKLNSCPKFEIKVEKCSRVNKNINRALTCTAV